MSFKEGLHMVCRWFGVVLCGLGHGQLPGGGGGGGGGHSIFFCIRRLRTSIYSSPQKNIRNFKHPKQIFEIFATQKYHDSVYLP